MPEIEFLGHVLSASGCSPLVKHTAAISELPVPAAKPGYGQFLQEISQGGCQSTSPANRCFERPWQVPDLDSDPQGCFPSCKGPPHQGS